jgi:hypothetical protein
MLIAVLHFLTDLTDAENPQGIVAALLGALPSGSATSSSRTSPRTSTRTRPQPRRRPGSARVSRTCRAAATVAAFFTGRGWSTRGVVPLPGLAAGRRRSGRPLAVRSCAAIGRKS